MMEVFSYSLGISICLLFGYLAFALFIADVKQPRFNRVLLWGIIAFYPFRQLACRFCCGSRTVGRNSRYSCGSR